MQNTLEIIPFVCDVGNNEFWCSQSYVRFKLQNRMLYSKSFGSLGSAIAKAIGVFYKTGNTVICFIGDQGLQMNIQEFQFISNHRIPIKVVCEVFVDGKEGLRPSLPKGRKIHDMVPDLQKNTRDYLESL